MSKEMDSVKEVIAKALFGADATTRPTTKVVDGKYVIEHQCVSCDKKVNPESDFRDYLSVKEFGISRMCQKCQDSVFNAPEEDY